MLLSRFLVNLAKLCYLFGLFSKLYYNQHVNKLLFIKNMFSKYLVYFDEITLKGKNKKFFIDKLRKNLKELMVLPLNIVGRGSKLVLEFSKELNFEQAREVEKALSLIPGVAKYAPVAEVRTDLEVIKKKALEICEFYKPNSFKMIASREYKKFNFTSPEISRLVGGYILKKGDWELKVKIKNPELVLGVEVGKEKSFVVGKRKKGVSGLPVGTAGRAICLLSGGLDSPVAAFQMMKRGVKVTFLHFQNKTINRQGVELKLRKIVERLGAVQGESELFIVPFEDLQKKVVAEVPADLRMLVYRRIMLKIADLFCFKLKAGAIITGDSVSQVASQTLDNLKVVYKASENIKLTPLIGFNKSEVIDIARKIKTYEPSILPYEDCCSFMIAKHPQTGADLDKVRLVEKGISLDLLKKAFDNTEQLTIKSR